MLRYIYGHDLCKYPELARSMFRDRACQFRDRLGWPVDVDANGEERDRYDGLDPLYVIWENADGSHGGSMRFLPTTGQVMVNDVFRHLTGADLVSPLIWECTRFCLNRSAGREVAAALMLGGGEIMNGFGVRHFVGVFDARMVRIYRMIGSTPEVLGSEGDGRDRISVGLWEFSPEAQSKVAARAGIPPALSRYWFDLSLGGVAAEPVAMSA